MTDCTQDDVFCGETILQTAKLARLKLDADCADNYAKDIGKILTMMDILAEVDTDGVAPLTNVHDMSQRLRDDVADSNIDREKNQSVAPSVAEGLYLVPQVIE